MLSDVDGVMTAGEIQIDAGGNESKIFHVRDGLGIKLWRLAGGTFGIISARTSQAVSVRAGELKVDFLRQGSEGKWAAAEQIIQKLKLTPEQVCYIGDDLTDLPVMQAVGLSACVADAAAELVQVSDYVCERAGGGGAVRELIEAILKAQQKWDATVIKYLRSCGMSVGV